MPPDYDVVIAGAGIIGASIAYHLSRLGVSVLLLDKSGPSSAATGSADGAVSVCSKKHQITSDFASNGLEYFGSLSKSGGILEDVFKLRPSFYFATNDAEVEVLDNLKDKLTASSGPVRIVNDAFGSTAIPGLGSCVNRVVEISGEGHMIGYFAVNRFLDDPKIAKRWPCEVIGFEETSGKVVVLTDRGEVSGRHFVLATGTSASKLVPHLPITPRAGQLIITDRGANECALPGNLVSASYLLSKSRKGGAPQAPPVVIDPLLTGQFLVGSSREEHGFTNRTDFATVKSLLTRAAQCFEPLLDRKILRVFSGVRAAVSDGRPIIGSVSETSRVIVATGFEGDGISLSAIVGREVANMVTGASVLPIVESFSPQRFVKSGM